MSSTIIVEIKKKWHQLLSSSINCHITDRLFQALIGVEPQILEYIFQKYSNGKELSHELELLWCFNFLKEYNSMDSHAAFWKTSIPTFRKYIWNVILYLNEVLDEVRQIFYLN